tara:strand:+ start:175 stop:366 length:192 start_codon:yes stop_codon:yes gene_type:complete
MTKDIKVIFRGFKAPSGKNTDVEYFIGKARLEQLQATKMFDIEIVEESKPKAKKTTPKKKGAK